MADQEIADYPSFRTEWIESIEQNSSNTVEKGRNFSHAMCVEALELADDDEVIYCDGSGDGGIDIAILKRGESDDNGHIGDTWYLVQSKYGSAWAGKQTAIQEGWKIIQTLYGHNYTLSSLADGMNAKLQHFIKNSSEDDQLILTFATMDPPSDEEKQALNELRDLGKKHFGHIFDVECLNIRTIYDRFIDDLHNSTEDRLNVPFKGALAQGADDLLVGVTALTDLYEFLKSFRAATQDLDQLYERNVRRFLGGRVKVNKAMQETLKNEPERFGLYNNGITIVVSDFKYQDEQKFTLSDPYVVNGCQTTRSIWEVLDRRLGSGGTGTIEDNWTERAKRAVVVVKIAKVGHSGDELLNKITRYTNSQNVVREKDFIALDNNFRAWQRRLEDEREIYLEIQRGGWASRRALQKQNPKMKQLKESANAHELLKVYGAGWLAEPGTAFGKNPPFLPGGSVFQRIMQREGEPFGTNDLYAAYLLQRAGEEAGFGRGAKKVSRRQTKYLFAFVAIGLLRDSLQKAEKPYDEGNISDALISVLSDKEARQALINSTGDVVDGYLQEGAEESVFEEEVYKERFGYDLNRFLKWDQLGRDLDKTPNLKIRLRFEQNFMGKSKEGVESVRDTILRAV